MNIKRCTRDQDGATAKEQFMKTRSTKTLWLVQTAILAAILLVMAITPVGFLKIGVISLTLLSIPVIVAAIVVGPASGAVLGTVFGLVSFQQCFGADPTGVILLSINPFTTFIMCVIPRLLMGLLVGLIFKAFLKIGKTNVFVFAFTSLCGSILNTLLFCTALILFFGDKEPISLLGKNALEIFVALLTTNALIEAIVCTIVGASIAKALDVFLKKRIQAESKSE